MPLFALVIGIVLVIAIVMFALLVGGIGLVRRGPPPSSGSKDVG